MAKTRYRLQGGRADFPPRRGPSPTATSGGLGAGSRMASPRDPASRLPGPASSVSPRQPPARLLFRDDLRIPSYWWAPE